MLPARSKYTLVVCALECDHVVTNTDICARLSSPQGGNKLGRIETLIMYSV